MTHKWRSLRSAAGFGLLTFLLTATVHAQFNSWTNPLSGKWEDPANWSAGAPTNSNTANLITNATTKTVTIDNGTPAANLTISNLTVQGVGSFISTLQLTNAGAATPLRVLNGLNIGSNAVLVVTNSVLRAQGVSGGMFIIDGSVTNLAGGQILTTNVSLSIGTTASSRGNLTTLGGLLQCSNNVLIGTAAGSQGTLTLSGGTNTLTALLGIGNAGGATGAVWVTDGLLVATNSNLIIGNIGIGQMTISNGTVLAGQVLLGPNAGAGTLTVAGGSNFLSRPLSISAFFGAPGSAVWVTGGRLDVTNSTISVGTAGDGQMTISNGIVVCANLIVASNSTARGTLTIAGGVTTLPGTLNVGLNLNSTGSVFMTGGQLVLGNQQLRLGASGFGQATMSGGLLSALLITVADQPSAKGALTMSGGTNPVFGLTVGSSVNATGAVWVTGSAASLGTIISSMEVGDAGSGQLTLSNGTVSAQTLRLGGNAGSVGTLTMAGGTLLVQNGPTVIGSNGVGQAMISGGTPVFQDLLVGRSNTGTLTTVGVTNSVLGALTIGLGTSSSGAVWVTGGSLVVTNNTTTVGAAAGFGQLTLSNSALNAHDIVVRATGRLALVGGTHRLSSTLNMAGPVSLADGHLSVTNQATTIGASEPGQMTISNSTFLARAVIVGPGGSTGTLTMQASTNILSNILSVGTTASSTGNVWMTGGLLVVTNANTEIGASGFGQMTISNGTALLPAVSVGKFSGSRGTLTLAGGSSHFDNNLTLGTFDCTATSTVVIAGGSAFVTNATGTAVLEVRSGTLQLTSGMLTIDSLVMGNACGRFIHTGGMLSILSTNISGGLDADGDGMANAFEQANGLNPFNPNDAGTDNDGDGQTNLAEFQSGTDPTNSASFFGITSITQVDTNILVTWQTGIGRTNALDRSAGDASGGFTNNFATIFTVTNTVGTVTNYLDNGAATNSPAQYYRVRLVP